MLRNAGTMRRISEEGVAGTPEPGSPSELRLEADGGFTAEKKRR